MLQTMIENQISDSIDAKKRLLTESHVSIIADVSTRIIDAYKNSGKVLLCGNGGSASDAQHIEGELVGRFKLERRALPAIALTANSSTVTAVSNDYGYNDAFRRQVEAHGQSGDILLAFSTSGNSANIIAAVEQAKSQGLVTIGMLGGTGGKLKGMVDLAFVAPSSDTPRIQECHILVGHIICGLVEKGLFSGNE